ncbi:MAG TPA: hypothetical protein VGU45_01460 [Microvirga sp.]|nr:hypothetical protein [Microvirga sp.]
MSSPSPIRREALEEAADLRDQLKQVLEGHVWEGRDWLVPLNDSDFPDCQAAVLDALVEFIRALASCDRSGAAAKTEGLGPEGESTVPRQGQTPPIRALIPGRTE